MPFEFPYFKVFLEVFEAMELALRLFLYCDRCQNSEMIILPIHTDAWILGYS